MSRWEPNASGRLEQAALELYAERGYEKVTVAEIAQRAGLTERTFFRHYADKREVLFAGSALLQQELTEAVTGAPAELPPIEVVVAALVRIGELFEQAERREPARQRQVVIDANPHLQERELVKHTRLTAAVTDALRQRGTPDRTASLAAQAGMAVFRVAFARWLEGTGRQSMPKLVRSTYAELRKLVADG